MPRYTVTSGQHRDKLTGKNIKQGKSFYSPTKDLHLTTIGKNKLKPADDSEGRKAKKKKKSREDDDSEEDEDDEEVVETKKVKKSKKKDKEVKKSKGKKKR